MIFTSCRHNKTQQEIVLGVLFLYRCHSQFFRGKGWNILAMPTKPLLPFLTIGSTSSSKTLSSMWVQVTENNYTGKPHNVSSHFSLHGVSLNGISTDVLPLQKPIVGSRRLYCIVGMHIGFSPFPLIKVSWTHYFTHKANVIMRVFTRRTYETVLTIFQLGWLEVVGQDYTTGVAGPLIFMQGRFTVTSRLQRPGPCWHWCSLACCGWRQSKLTDKQASCLHSLAAEFLLLPKSLSYFPEWLLKWCLQILKWRGVEGSSQWSRHIFTLTNMTENSNQCT